MGSIVALRNEIQEYIKLIGMTEYNLSDEEKMVLDEFFNRSSNRVIENLLERLRHVLSDDKRSMEFSTGFVPRKKFKLATPAVKFPNSFHEHAILYYLEEKYAEKFVELGFDQIGISNPRIVGSLATVSDDLHLQYTSPDRSKFFKDTSFAYGLEVDVDVRKIEKNKELSKKRTN